LRLFDGSSNTTVTKSVKLPIRFPSGDLISVSFLVTPLDSSFLAVLGFNWLTCYNPLIDWVTSSITFQTPIKEVPRTFSADSVLNITKAKVNSSVLSGKQVLLPSVLLIGAAAFAQTTQAEGSQIFAILSTSKSLQGRSASLNSDTSNLTAIPLSYREFADVFSNIKSKELAPH
jgi:hypothetical protein